MALDLSQLIPILAKLEAEDRLAELDTVEFPETGVTRWLFGLAADFYFARDEQVDRREVMIDLAEGYYDRTDGRCNFMSAGPTFTIKSRDDIRNKLTEGRAARRYWDRRQNGGFYIKHNYPEPMRNGDPVHDWFSCLIPGLVSTNGELQYLTRLKALRDHPDTVVADFVATCAALKIFYAVQGFSLLTLGNRPQRDAYPIYRRFPGLLYNDLTGFSLEIEPATDVILDVNWLTAIDSAMFEKIGGMEAAQDILSDEVVLHPFDGGMVFQAGPTPRIGDINRGDIPKPYREVNELLRPLRFTDWQMPFLSTPQDVNAMEATEDWIRRFDAS
ncbi:type VI immunity family protein [Paracoccus pacificus]|uniref:Type VI immunity family protein n=1 Tax=Paracoccus pacificus TaxID=1463598 RepID=A0ABW4R5K3_9RHOB